MNTNTLRGFSQMITPLPTTQLERLLESYEETNPELANVISDELYRRCSKVVWKSFDGRIRNPEIRRVIEDAAKVSYDEWLRHYMTQPREIANKLANFARYRVLIQHPYFQAFDKSLAK